MTEQAAGIPAEEHKPARLVVTVSEIAHGQFQTDITSEHLYLDSALSAVRELRAASDRIFAQVAAQLGPDLAVQLLHGHQTVQP